MGRMNEWRRDTNKFDESILSIIRIKSPEPRASILLNFEALGANAFGCFDIGMFLIPICTTLVQTYSLHCIRSQLLAPYINIYTEFSLGRYNVAV